MLAAAINPGVLTLTRTVLPHWAASPNGDLSAATSLADTNWHYWAGVYDPWRPWNFLHHDGVMIATARAALGNEQYPVNRRGRLRKWRAQFPGNIAQVAVYTNALTATQVNSLYSAAGGSLPHASVLISSITIDEGANTNITGSASGTLPLGIQWYVISAGVTNPVSGATSLTLALTDVLAAQSGNRVSSCSPAMPMARLPALR